MAATERPTYRQEDQEIPIGYRRIAAWGWRFLVAVAVLWVLAKIIAPITTLVIPVLVAVLLAAFLMPLVKLLTKYTFLPRGASAGIVLIGMVAVVSGMFVLAGRQLMEESGKISEATVIGFQKVTQIASDTFNLDLNNLNQYTDQLIREVQSHSGSILQGALTGFSTVSNIVAGLILCLFTLFFFLASGDRIWRWVVCLLPAQARIPAHESFRRGWRALSAYVRTQVLVAAVDAVSIAVGMFIPWVGLGSYAVPIGLLVFMFSFVPIVGAIVSGVVAVLLALVLKGWVAAIIMIGIVLAVQQIEGNILQPFLMGNAVNIHPLAVLLGVAGGTMVAGIPGALFAIPMIAFLNSVLLYLTGRDGAPEMGVDPAAQELVKRPAGASSPIPQPRMPGHRPSVPGPLVARPSRIRRMRAASGGRGRRARRTNF
ncbi:AI-2E family transporter [Devriesea agamarum]|uniref:AI-2E family transporter n=1 Tax=Devriesea agamarum TaxID=472569 RepID=UPI000A079139|nr:AI-2E family transporter [Devriesea agamarum]